MEMDQNGKIPYFIEITKSRPGGGSFYIRSIFPGGEIVGLEVRTPPPHGAFMGIVENGVDTVECGIWAVEHERDLIEFIEEGSSAQLMQGHGLRLGIREAASMIFKNNHPDDLKGIFGIEELREALDAENA